MSRINQSWYTSGRDDWATPRWLFAELDREFRFTLDPCATAENATCPDYITPERNGLACPWSGRVFINPPYGRDTGAWFRHGLLELAAGRAEILVYLTPARTDTAWFHAYILRASELRFIRGRLTYGLGQAKSAAPFPSCLSIFRPGEQGPPTLRSIPNHVP